MNTDSGDREPLIFPRIVVSCFLSQVFTISQ